MRYQNEALHRATARIVAQYRESLGKNNRPLSFARFADELTQYSKEHGLKVSYQAVKFWADGVHSPDYWLVMKLHQLSPDGSWQHAFAEAILGEYHKLC